jgi:beta-fructofuranosidase
MLRLEDHWVWDSWHVQEDSGLRHAFFLRASRALLDPDRRHHRASVGHAVSTDLRTWRLVADALVPADEPSWDDLATWTGSIVRGPDDRWYFFYTGVSRAEKGLVQRIGLATSDDLLVWRRCSTRPLLEPDPRWYETLDLTQWYEQAWRDPWVYADPSGDGWHMLITARRNHGAAGDRGVIGHARSSDLVTWTVEPPLSNSSGFGHLEVPQVAVVDGHPLLLFCTNGVNGQSGTDDRIWFTPGPTVNGPWDLASARPFPHPYLYAPRLVPDIDGTPTLIGFLDQVDGVFAGELTDPIRVRYDPVVGLVAEANEWNLGRPGHNVQHVRAEPVPNGHGGAPQAGRDRIL